MLVFFFFRMLTFCLFSAQQNWKIGFNNREWNMKCLRFAMNISVTDEKKTYCILRSTQKHLHFYFLNVHSPADVLKWRILVCDNIVCIYVVSWFLLRFTAGFIHNENRVEPMTDQKRTKHQRRQRQQHTFFVHENNSIRKLLLLVMSLFLTYISSTVHRLWHHRSRSLNMLRITLQSALIAAFILDWLFRISFWPVFL